MSTRFSISLLLSMMVSAVLFGIGATTVLSIPSLSEHAPILLPIVIVLSFVFGPIVSWVIAPKLRAKYSREVEAKRLEVEQPGHRTQ
jgi:membrane protein YqaA with SNARE-associated domain